MSTGVEYSKDAYRVVQQYYESSTSRTHVCMNTKLATTTGTYTVKQKVRMRREKNTIPTQKNKIKQRQKPSSRS